MADNGADDGKVVLTELVEHSKARKMPLKKLITEVLGRLEEEPPAVGERIQLVRQA
jgi:hypothetical protein